MSILYVIRFILIVGGGAVFFATLLAVMALVAVKVFSNSGAGSILGFGARELILIFFAPGFVLSVFYFRRIKMI